MTDTLTLYTNPMSRGRIARWMLEEIGAPYETRVLDYGAAMKTPEYLAINPMGKVPTLCHGNAVITECAAICAYLADAFPAADLAPRTDERADYHRWLFFFAGPVESAVVIKALEFEVPEDRRVMAGWGHYGLVLDTVEKLLTDRQYICGDRFTAADVYCGAQIGWGIQFGTIEARPAFKAYWERLEGRAAWLKATELDDALVGKP